MNEPPTLDIVDFVTREHGDQFADEWFRLSQISAALPEAISATGVMAWPDNNHDLQQDYHEIEHEIAQRVSDQLRSTIAETFVRLANEILALARLG
jgi:hypothetical protein